jgi:hypothetical protein
MEMKLTQVFDLKDVVQEIDLRDRCYKGLITIEQYLKQAVLPASKTDPLAVDIISNGLFGDICFAATAGRKALCTTWKQWLGRRLRELRLCKAFRITHHIGWSERFNEHLIFFKVSGLLDRSGEFFEDQVFVLAHDRVCFRPLGCLWPDDVPMLKKELEEYSKLYDTGFSKFDKSMDLLVMEDITWVS